MLGTVVLKLVSWIHLIYTLKVHIEHKYHKTFLPPPPITLFLFVEFPFLFTELIKYTMFYQCLLLLLRDMYSLGLDKHFQLDSVFSPCYNAIWSIKRKVLLKGKQLFLTEKPGGSQS